MLRFGELLELWREDNSLTQAVHDSHNMLESTLEMFRQSVDSLRRSDNGEVDRSVYEKDQIVNKYEQEVRGKVLKHLAVTGGVNLIPGLILTSIVIDIERIGDYTKNIVDLAISHPKKLTCGDLEKDVKQIESGVMEIFENIIPFIRSSEKKATRELVDSHWWIFDRCDKIVNQLVKGEDYSLNLENAVSTALYIRYLKRVGGHLVNIASSIVNPFEKIGFRAGEVPK